MKKYIILIPVFNDWKSVFKLLNVNNLNYDFEKNIRNISSNCSLSNIKIPPISDSNSCIFTCNFTSNWPTNYWSRVLFF